MKKKLAILDRCIGKWDDKGGIHTYYMDYLIPLLHKSVDIVYCYPDEKLKSSSTVSEIQTKYTDVEVRYVGNYSLSDWKDIDVIFAPDSFIALDNDINEKLYEFLKSTNIKIVYAFQTNPKSMSLNRSLSHNLHLSGHPNTVAVIYYSPVYPDEFYNIYLVRHPEIKVNPELKSYIHVPYVGYMNTSERSPHHLDSDSLINIGYLSRTSSVKGYKDFLTSILKLSEDDLSKVGHIYYASNLDSMGMWDKKFYKESLEMMSTDLRDKFIPMNYNHNNIYDVMNNIDVGFVPTRFKKICYPGEWTTQELLAAGVIPAYNNLDHESLPDGLKVLTDYEFHSVVRHRDLEISKVLNYKISKINKDKDTISTYAEDLMDSNLARGSLLRQLQLI